MLLSDKNLGVPRKFEKKFWSHGTGTTWIPFSFSGVGRMTFTQTRQQRNSVCETLSTHHGNWKLSSANSCKTSLVHVASSPVDPKATHQNIAQCHEFQYGALQNIRSHTNTKLEALYPESSLVNGKGLEVSTIGSCCVLHKLQFSDQIQEKAHRIQPGTDH